MKKPFFLYTGFYIPIYIPRLFLKSIHGLYGFLWFAVFRICQQHQERCKERKRTERLQQNFKIKLYVIGTRVTFCVIFDLYMFTHF